MFSPIRRRAHKLSKSWALFYFWVNYSFKINRLDLSVLEKISVVSVVFVQGSETTIFPCERWLARSEDDGETVRELVPSDIITEKLLRDGTLKHSEIEVEDALESTSALALSYQLSLLHSSFNQAYRTRAGK